MKIINLTKTPATFEQKEAGVIDLPTDRQAVLNAVLTFNDLPGKDDIFAIASAIRKIAFDLLSNPASKYFIAPGERYAMIGGPVFLMSALEHVLRCSHITPLYSFSAPTAADQPPPATDNEIIDRLGGTTKVANLFGIAYPSVSQWRQNGIPKARMIYLKLRFPEVFNPTTTKHIGFVEATL